jgi:ABC-type amino acid transport substrate-binding protein
MMLYYLREGTRMSLTRQGGITATAAALALVVGMVGWSAAQSTLEMVKKRGKLIAGVKTDFPPFGTIDAGGNNVGFDVDVARLFAKALFNDATQVELVAVTSGNRIPFLQSGKIDIIIATVTVTDERRQVVEFSEPYFLSGSLLLVPKASAARGLEDMAGKTIAVVQGAIQDKDVAELQPKATRIKFGKVSEAVLAVKGGRADAYVHDDIVIRSLAKENPDLKAVGKPFMPRPYGIAVRKGDTEFIQWVNAQLDRMRQDGTYDHLWKHYFADVEANLVKP